MTRIDSLLAKGTTFSFELMPATNEKREAALDRALPELEDLDPSFVSVTYGAGGSTRGGTHDLVKRLLDEGRTVPMAHLTTAGQSRTQLKEMLERYRADGLENILALRGDPPLDAESMPEGELTNAMELVELAREVGDFCIAVAAHPEGHPAAKTREEDLAFQLAKFKRADFAITQFFFDVDAYFAFVNDLSAMGNTTPIIPGIIAPVSVTQLERMAEMSHTEVPHWVHDRLVGDDEEAVAAAGVGIAVDLAKKLLAGGAPGIHIYTLNHSAPARAIYNRLF